ncbi:MAG: hypothetical protein R3D02_15075, partial [Hyphomicrobiales bacterium]
VFLHMGIFTRGSNAIYTYLFLQVYGLANAILFAWMAISTARWRILGRNVDVARYGSKLRSLAWTLLYILMIGGLLFLALIATGLVGVLFMKLVGRATGYAVFMLCYPIVPYMLVRFLIAAPGLAIGLRPHLFREMWPFARGRVWSVLGWLAASAALVFLFSLGSFALFLFGLNMQKDLAAELRPLETLSSFKVLGWHAVSSLASILYLWFASVFLSGMFIEIAMEHDELDARPESGADG